MHASSTDSTRSDPFDRGTLAVWCNRISIVDCEATDSGSNPDMAAIPTVQGNARRYENATTDT